MVYFSAQTGGFYSSGIHGKNMPASIVEIADSEHLALLMGQSQGKIIAADENGFPVLVNPPPPEPEQIEAAKITLVQAHMDKRAQALEYVNIADAVTYAEEPAVPKFQAEGQVLRAWRSLVRAKWYEILDDVQKGNRPFPSDEDLIAELPTLELP